MLSGHISINDNPNAYPNPEILPCTKLLTINLTINLLNLLVIVNAGPKCHLPIISQPLNMLKYVWCQRSAPDGVTSRGNGLRRGIRLTPHPLLCLDPHTEGMRPILQ